jgi:hypothetical protein
MPTPVILVNGAAPPPLGAAANGTFVLSDTVNLSVSNYTLFGSIHWVVESKPDGATSALGAADPAAPYTTTYGPLDVEGTYLLRAEGNGNGATEYARIAICVPTKAAQIRIPAVSEETGWDPANGWAKAYAEMAGFVDRGNGMTTVAMADANQTLTKTQYAKKTLKATGALTASRNMILPLIEGASWHVINATTGSYSVMVGGATGTKVAIPVQTAKQIFCDGTNFYTGPDAVLTYGPSGSAPAAGVAGCLRVENSSVQPLYVDDGAEWRPIIGGSLGYVPPVAALFTNSFLGPATYTDRGWTGEIKSNSPGTANVLGKAVAVTAPYTITAHLMQGGADCKFGLLFINSTSGKLHTLEIDTINSEISSTKWTDTGTISAAYVTITNVYSRSIWLRIADDGVNRVCSYSYDGRNFYAFHTVGRTDFLTADQVGWYQRDTANLNTTVTLVSWKQT